MTATLVTTFGQWKAVKEESTQAKLDKTRCPLKVSDVTHFH